MPRIRTWPTSAEPGFLGSVAFKAGMTHVTMVDDSESPSKGTEVARSVTVLEVPKVYIYGVRFYNKKYLYTQPAAEAYDATLAKRLGINKQPGSVEALKQRLSEFMDASALAFVDPSNLGIGNRKLMRMELQVGGKDTAEKLAFIEKHLGKEIKAADVAVPGDYIDVIGITTGKGWAGVIKRFGVAKQGRKNTNKVRHLGVLGPWHPSKVMFTVPHSGHMGYNYRTERNKRILKVGAEKDAASINTKGGFMNYGVVKNDFIIVDGSVPGPVKRMLRFRKALRNSAPKKEPQVTYVSLASKQGA